MNYYLLFMALIIVIGIIVAFNNKNDYLDKDSTASLKGIFLLQVFYRHIKSYLDVSQYESLLVNKVDLFLGQFIVTPFLFLSGYGVMESIKKKKDKYINSIPLKRCLITLLNFMIAVLLFYIVDCILGIKYPLKTVLLSFVTWESIGNSNWYIFAIICLYFITYISFKIFDKDYKKATILTWLLTVILIIGISLFKDSWWYDTLLVYPLGISYSLHKEAIDKLLKDKIKYWLILITLTISFAIIFKGFIYQPYIYNIEACLFVLIIVIILFRIRHKLYLTKWLGTNIFSFYIMMRIPMIIFSKYSIVNNALLYTLVCFASSILITFLFSLIIKIIDSLLERK